MKIEFFINDKSHIPTVLRRLAISLTLKQIHTVFIDDKEYNLREIRKELFRNLTPDIRDKESEI
jgi:hypothetical protein